MRNKDTIKSFLLSLFTMGIVSVLGLLLLSALTYLYKWQASQAMIGITLTYIITGILGGVVYGVLKHGCPSLRERIVEGGILGGVYVALLFVLAMALADGHSIEYKRWFSMVILVVCSTIFGNFFADLFYRN